MPDYDGLVPRPSAGTAASSTAASTTAAPPAPHQGGRGGANKNDSCVEQTGSWNETRRAILFSKTWQQAARAASTARCRRTSRAPPATSASAPPSAIAYLPMLKRQRVTRVVVEMDAKIACGSGSVSSSASCARGAAARRPSADVAVAVAATSKSTRIMSDEDMLGAAAPVSVPGQKRKGRAPSLPEGAVEKTSTTKAPAAGNEGTDGTSSVKRPPPAGNAAPSSCGKVRQPEAAFPFAPGEVVELSDSESCNVKVKNVNQHSSHDVEVNDNDNFDFLEEDHLHINSLNSGGWERGRDEDAPDHTSIDQLLIGSAPTRHLDQLFDRALQRLYAPLRHIEAQAIRLSLSSSSDRDRSCGSAAAAAGDEVMSGADFVSRLAPDLPYVLAMERLLRDLRGKENDDLNVLLAGAEAVASPRAAEAPAEAEKPHQDAGAGLKGTGSGTTADEKTEGMREMKQEKLTRVGQQPRAEKSVAKSRRRAERKAQVDAEASASSPSAKQGRDSADAPEVKKTSSSKKKVVRNDNKGKEVKKLQAQLKTPPPTDHRKKKTPNTSSSSSGSRSCTPKSRTSVVKGQKTTGGSAKKVALSKNKSKEPMKPDARRRTKKSIKETKKSTVKEKAAKENKKQPPKAAKLSKNNAKSANNESTSSISKKRTAAERLKLQTTKKSRAQQRLDHKIAEAAKEKTNNHGSDDENPVLLRRKKDRFDPEQHGVSLDHYLLLAAQKVALAADHFSAADQENGTNRLQLPDQHGIAENPTGALAKLRGVGGAIKDQAPPGPAADHADIHEGAIIPAELGFLRANKAPEEHPLAGVVVKAGAIGDWMKKSCVAGRNLEVHVVVGRKMVFTVVAELAEDVGDVEAAVGLGSAGCVYKNVRLADIRNRSRLQKDFAKLAAYFRDAKQQWVLRSRNRGNKERAGTTTLLQNNQKVDEPELQPTSSSAGADAEKPAPAREEAPATCPAAAPNANTVADAGRRPPLVPGSSSSCSAGTAGAADGVAPEDVRLRHARDMGGDHDCDPDSPFASAQEWFTTAPYRIRMSCAGIKNTITSGPGEKTRMSENNKQRLTMSMPSRQSPASHLDVSHIVSYLLQHAAQLETSLRMIREIILDFDTNRSYSDAALGGGDNISEHYSACLDAIHEDLPGLLRWQPQVLRFGLRLEKVDRVERLSRTGMKENVAALKNSDVLPLGAAAVDDQGRSSCDDDHLCPFRPYNLNESEHASATQKKNPNGFSGGSCNPESAKDLRRRLRGEKSQSSKGRKSATRTAMRATSSSPVSSACASKNARNSTTTVALIHAPTPTPRTSPKKQNLRSAPEIHAAGDPSNSVAIRTAAVIRRSLSPLRSGWQVLTDLLFGHRRVCAGGSLQCRLCAGLADVFQAEDFDVFEDMGVSAASSSASRSSFRLFTAAELTRFAQRVRNHLETCMNCRPLFGVAGVEIGHYFRDPLPRKASSPTNAERKRQKTENHVAGMNKSKGEDAEVERKDKESDEIEISSAPEEFEDDPKPSAVVSSFHWVRFDGSRVPDPLRTRRLHAQEQDPDAFDLVDEETLDDSLPPKLFSLDLRGFQMYGSQPGRIRHRDKDLLLDVKGKVPVDGGEREQRDNVDIKRVGVGVGQGQREQHGHEGILLPQNPALFFGKKEFVERLQWNGAELERAVETDPAFGWLRKAWGAREGLVGLLDAARGNLGALDDGNDDDSDEGL